MNKSYLVFGGSGNLGQFVVNALAEQEDCIIWSSYFRNKLSAKRLNIRQFYYDANMDLSDTVIKKILNRDILGMVFMIGIPSSKKSILETSDDEWNNLFHINALSFINCVRPFVLKLLENKARIVVVSSSASKNNKAYSGSYSMSKQALESIALTLSNELDELKINILRPSLFQSELARYIAKKKGYVDFSQYVQDVLNGEILSCDQVGAMLIKMLTSEEWKDRSGCIVEM